MVHIRYRCSHKTHSSYDNLDQWPASAVVCVKAGVLVRFGGFAARATFCGRLSELPGVVMGGPGNASRDVIQLKGSADIVGEFLCYAVNSILYQRGLYPMEEFVRVKKYGLTLLQCKVEQVKAYINSVVSQLSDWLGTGALQRVVLVVQSMSTSEVLERWNFNIETEKEASSNGSQKEKSDREIMAEIQAIMRQITSSVTFLPILEETCTFDLLAYTSIESEVPTTWGESDARLIDNPQVVKLRAFDTKVHKVDALVAYKRDDDE